MFFCGTFELCMEITLQLRFVFVRPCEVLFITSQLRYLFVRCSYVFLMTFELSFILVRSNYVWKATLQLRFVFFIIVTYFLLRPNSVICLFDVVTFFDYVRITLYFGTFELRLEITL